MLIYDETIDNSSLRSKTKKLCIVIGHNSPYLVPCQFSQKYTTLTCENLAKRMAERDIKLSVLSPRKNEQLKKIFEAVSKFNIVSNLSM